MTDENAVSDMYDKVPVDEKRGQEILKRNQPPAGIYVTLLEDYEPLVTPFKFEGETRQQFNVFLRAGQRTRGGDVVEQGLKFRFSQIEAPAKVFGTNEIIEGKDDSATKRYAELQKAFRDWQGVDGEPLKDVDQLIEMIKGVPLNFKTMNGDNGLNVTGISYKRSR